MHFKMFPLQCSKHVVYAWKLTAFDSISTVYSFSDFLNEIDKTTVIDTFTEKYNSKRLSHSIPAWSDSVYLLTLEMLKTVS